MGEEIPKRMWYEIFDRFTRRDELLVEILKDMRALLRKVVPEVVVAPPPTIPLIEVPEITLPEWRIIDRLARRLQQLPNRLDKIDIDTSKTSWRSLRSDESLKGAVLLGFYVEDVGGGFSYKVTRESWESPDKTAVVDEKWDIEFDDLAVLGTGTAGTAVLWYLWREVTRPRLRRA